MKLKVFGMAASVMLFGCVTVEQFEKMSSSERADFICSRDKTVINLQSSINNSLYGKYAIQQKISNGYETKSNCESVKVQTPRSVSCGTTYGVYTSNTNCNVYNDTQYEQRCTESHVPINVDTEKEKLQQVNNYINSAEKEKSEAYSRCYSHIYKMSPEEVYLYYNQ
jgi:hypothetical protein